MNNFSLLRLLVCPWSCMWEALSTAQSQGCGFTCPGNRPEWVAWRICIFIVQSVLRHLHVDITECPYCDRVDITVHIVALVSMNSSGYAVWHYTVQQDFFSMLVCFFVPYPVSTEWGVSFVSTLHLRVCVCVCVLRGVGERERQHAHTEKKKWVTGLNMDIIFTDGGEYSQ